MAKSNKCLIVPYIIGVVVLVIGVVLGFVIFPNILYNAVTSNVILKEDTLQWYRFREIPFPINFKINFFTITNPQEVLQNGEKPIVKVVGPYVYKETRKKIIYEKETTDDLVVYDELWSFQFSEEESEGRTEDDVITVINSPLMAILQNLEELTIPFPVPVEQIVDDIFENTNVFFDVKVGDYGHNGIKMCDPNNSKTGYSKLVCLAIMLMRQKLIIYNQDLSMSFSLFGYKSNPDGTFGMRRGIKDIDKLGLITSYKGKEYTNYWKGEQSSCDKVDGHYTTFPPYMKPEGFWKVYSTDICKSGKLNYVKESSFKNIDSYRYETNKFSFASPEEECVCIDKTKGLDGKTHCYNNGVLDLNTCLGVPVILSFPHLMLAGTDYQTTVEGLDTDYGEKYNTAIEFQPTLGIPLKGAIRIQFNIVLRPIKYNGEFVKATEHVSNSLFPIIWLEDSFELTDNLIEEINAQLLDKTTLIDQITWSIIGIGIGVIAITLFYCIFCRCSNCCGSSV